MLLAKSHFQKTSGFFIVGFICLFAGSAEAAGFKTITVPYTWELEVDGEFDAAKWSVNYGGLFNEITDSRALQGSFTARFIHTPPTDGTLMDTLPTSVLLQGRVRFSADLKNQTVGGSIVIKDNTIGVNTFAKASASINLPISAPLNSYEIGSVSTGGGVQNRAFSINLVKDQAFGVDGSVDVSTKYGLDINPFGNELSAAARLIVFNVRLQKPSGRLMYKIPETCCPTSQLTPSNLVASIGSMFLSLFEQPAYASGSCSPCNNDAVPEPFTILGATTALGMGAFFKRQISKRQSKEATKV